MNYFSTDKIRELFINFFKNNGHIHIKSSNLVPDSDSTALFSNSGMFQFKDIFTGAKNIEHKRAVTSQKCLRVGGKHNDLENVGFTARHHTFFEMLGNFSFGDYFKEEAISYAWKFLTEELRIPPERLIVTVFHEDFEAIEIWKRISGFDDSKIIKINSKDNFWEMGGSGPCGPCSEIFYDYGESHKGGLPGSKEQDDGERYIEIWNLVFMQYERINGELLPLPKKSIDTGMGLERIAAVCQNVHDNYQIDIFRSLIDEFKKISNIDFEVKMEDAGYVASRVAADHIRSASFLIAEGLIPGNNGREYVLKRIIRRASIFLYKIGYKEKILGKLSKKLVSIMSSTYKELEENKDFIYQAISNEESAFLNTLKNSMSEFEEIIKTKYSFQSNSPKIFLGEDIFRLYDTFGLPVDITEDLAFAHGFLFDKDGFEKLMEKQKETARKSWKGSKTYEKENNEFFLFIKENYDDTEFVGYEEDSSLSRLIGVISSKSNPRNKSFIFSKTPVYAESGGQISDSGYIYMINSNIEEKFAEITDVKTKFGLYIHSCYIFDETKLDFFEKYIEENFKKLSNESIEEVDFFICEDNIFELKIEIDIIKRNNIRKNHTAAHLLHSSLRKILGENIYQKGSSVSDSRLRFDFNFSGPVPESKLYEIENLVNLVILKNIDVCTKKMNRDDAVKEGAMALFDEKYSDIVRVVKIYCDNNGICTIGGNFHDQKEFISKELCGGTHVNKTSEIMLFKIISEEAVASGIRRIEAITGNYAFNFLNESYRNLNSLTKLINIKKDDFAEFVQNLIKKNKENEAKINDLEKSILISKISNFSRRINLNKFLDSIEMLFFSLDNLNSKLIRNAAYDFVNLNEKCILIIASRFEIIEKNKKGINIIINMNEKYFSKILKESDKKAFLSANIILGEIHNMLNISTKASGNDFFASSGSNQDIEYDLIFKSLNEIFN